MDNLQKLKNAKNLSDVASLLGFKSSALSYILYVMPTSEKYTLFDIPKKNGGTRTIKAPEMTLKNLQRRLSNVLNGCLREIEKTAPNNLAHGFKEGYSIQTNAKCHTKKRYVLNIDLKDFFPSFNFGRVRGFFIKNNHFQLDSDVATILAQIACHDNELPQGSPCSPVISNLIAHILDVRMVHVAKKNHCTYSRYADDITFSTSQKTFPSDIANYVSDKWIVSDYVKTKVERCGFEINESKTRMQHKDRRQSVTGLIANRKVNVRKEYYKNARAMLFHFITTGNYFTKSMINPLDTGEEKVILNDLNILDGIVSHIVYTKSFNKDREDRPVMLNRSFYKLIERYQYLKYFGLSDKPLIVTEGKTDIGHLKFALMKLHKRYPSLVTENGGNYAFQLSFLKHNKKFMGITGGSGDLNRVISSYDDIVAKIPAWAPLNPVILFVDNDSGIKSIAKTINNKFKKNVSVSEDDDFTYLTKNMYLVKTPHVEGLTETCIEDFYARRWLEVKLDGKKFNKTNKNTPDSYSKEIFLKAIIAKNYNSISFDNFKPILERLEKVLLDWENRKKS